GRWAESGSESTCFIFADGLSCRRRRRSVHEKRDLNVRAVLRFALGLVIVAALLHGALLALFSAFRRAEERADVPPHPLATSPAIPPSPRLEVAPRAALEALHREEERLLNSYGWVDRAQGRVRIPLSRALDLVEKRGLLARTGAPPAD